MARNQEKAQAMLNRFLQGKKDALKKPKAPRPVIAGDCDNLADAQRWRGQVVYEISRNVGLIQDGTLGEHKIRDLNDHINKLIREKNHWERQIKLLGGPDRTNYVQVAADGDGTQPIENDGYFYFGAARELPGVRELFEAREAAQSKRVNRGELYKKVDADYYGYRDEDDGLLVKLEREAEEKARSQAIHEWEATNQIVVQENQDPAQEEVLRAHVVLPSKEDIEAQLIAKRKEALLKKYAADVMH